MKYGVLVPPFGPCSDPATLVSMAVEAEAAGWDGFFLWDDITAADPVPIADAWISLAAVAARTTTIRIGATVTPLARRRPWKVAREAITLDHLSQGRLTVGVGLGVSTAQFDDLGDEPDPRARADMLDEGLDILAGLWRGTPFHHEGQHFHIREAHFLPLPIQIPRIPIWVGGFWPNKPPLRRAARWDGVFPLGRGIGWTEMLSPAAMEELVEFVMAERHTLGLMHKPFDVVHCGVSAGIDPAVDAQVAQRYGDVGVTWWLEHLVPERWGDWTDWPLSAMRHRVRHGPPRPSHSR